MRRKREYAREHGMVSKVFAIRFSDGTKIAPVRPSSKSPKIALTNAAMALASGGSGGGGSLTASAVGGGKSNPPVYQLSCDNEVKIVKFRYNFLIHNIFERINGELEKLIKVR